MPVSTGSILCVDCGTTNDAGAKSCWLCGQALTEDAVAISPYPALAVSRPAQFDAASLVLIVTVFAVGIGVGAIEPGLLIPYIILAVPALVATHTKANKRRDENLPMSSGEKVLSFFVSAATIFAVIIGVLLAVAIAVGLVCAAICFSGGLNFR